MYSLKTNEKGNPVMMEMVDDKYETVSPESWESLTKSVGFSSEAAWPIDLNQEKLDPIIAKYEKLLEKETVRLDATTGKKKQAWIKGAIHTINGLLSDLKEAKLPGNRKRPIWN